MRIRTLLSVAAAGTIVPGTPFRAAAADITWAAPVTETGNPLEILTDGALAAAVTTGHDATVNGVSFVGQTSMKVNLVAFGASPITLDAVQSRYGQYGAPPPAWNKDYQSLVAGGAYSEYPTSPMVIHLNGLTVGDRYTVQIFEAFWNTNFATAFVGGQKTSAPLNLSGAAKADAGASSTPQYVVGTFVADSSSESIFLASKTGYVIFAAMQARDLGAPPGTSAGNPNTNQIISALRPDAAAKSGGAASGAPSLDLSIEFKSGSAILTPAAIQELDKLGSALTSSDLSSDKFRIEGHTDTVGAAAANKVLSQQRADAAASYLEKKFNIASERLQTVGVGEEDLLVPTPDQTPELRNRRVHIVNLGTYTSAVK